MNTGKAKSRGGAKKRFRLTASGRIKRKSANHRHILTKKSGKRKRQLLSPAYVHETEEKKIKVLLGE